jgi:hypothetical protein
MRRRASVSSLTARWDTKDPQNFFARARIAQRTGESRTLDDRTRRLRDLPSSLVATACPAITCSMKASPRAVGEHRSRASFSPASGHASVCSFDFVAFDIGRARFRSCFFEAGLFVAPGFEACSCQSRADRRGCDIRVGHCRTLSIHRSWASDDSGSDGKARKRPAGAPIPHGAAARPLATGRLSHPALTPRAPFELFDAAAISLCSLVPLKQKCR